MLIATGFKALDAKLHSCFPPSLCGEIRIAVLGCGELDKAATLQNWGLIVIVKDSQSFPAAILDQGTAPVILVSRDRSSSQLEANCIREILYAMRQMHKTEKGAYFYNHLTPFFQEIRRISQTPETYSFEALARLQIGSGEIIMPEDIFSWVSPTEHALIFKSLCEKSHFPSDTRIAFNLDCSALLNDEAYTIVVQAVITSSLCITLEINEAAYHVQFDEAEKLMVRLEELTQLGVTLAIDDFGKNHSNYDRLHEVGHHFSQIKIDKELFHKMVAGYSHSVASKRLHSLITGFPAHIKEIVIEGVEREFHASVLTLLQTRVRMPILSQGFYQGAPIPLPKENAIKSAAGGDVWG